MAWCRIDATWIAQLAYRQKEDGIIERQVYAEVPPRVEYFLSDLGNTLRPIVDVMAEWGLGCQTIMNSNSKERKMS